MYVRRLPVRKVMRDGREKRLCLNRPQRNQMGSVRRVVREVALHQLIGSEFLDVGLPAEDEQAIGVVAPQRMFQRFAQHGVGTELHAVLL